MEYIVAIVILGLNQLRMTASGLTFTGQMKGSGQELKDSITRSILSGLIARHLAQRSQMEDAEEAFICGLFQNLGENLFGTLWQFGWFESVCTNDAVMAAKQDKLARAVHAQYEKDSKTGVKWENLDDGLRDENRQVADHLVVKLRALGFLAV